MKLLKPLSFSLMGVMILMLIAGSVVEQIYGTAAAVRYVYTAPWTIILWAITALSGLAYLIYNLKLSTLNSKLSTFFLHFSFVIILGGAMVTHLWGEQGDIHLRIGETVKMPAHTDIQVELKDFEIEYYAGSMAHADYVSAIEVNGTAAKVSMNNIYSYRHFRFYQSQFDSDMQGVTLHYSHDPWGIGITYAGYGLLLLSMIGFFFQRKTYFRALLKQLSVVALLLFPLTAHSSPITYHSPSGEPEGSSPLTVPPDLADAFGSLYIYYNDRVCPVQTLATDFTTKLYGKPSYKGLNANQVLCGWLFYYDQWAKEPCIKIKGKETRRVLEIDGKYACLNDFAGHHRYKLDSALRAGNKDARAADEKFQLISQVCTGQMIRIYPVADSTGQCLWYSWSDHLSGDIDFEHFRFIKRSMEYVFLCVARNASSEATDALHKIRAWQVEQAPKEQRPSAFRFGAERFYTAFHYTRPLAMACATAGLLLFIVCCILLSRGKQLPAWAAIGCICILTLVTCILLVAFILRWTVSGHVPLSNGFETMQFMALVSALITLGYTITHRKSQISNFKSLLIASGFLVTGMTLMVSMMSASNPRISHLMPVLQSPLLTIHVAVIMIAYCLLAFIMLNGVAALCVPSIRTRMQALSQLLTYPALFCLTTGIFIGAVWANISWGRYWGWDPKETWALITMLVYALLLHWPFMNLKIDKAHSTVIFHILCIVAFLFVLFTYFGVSYVLGGLHSYS